MKRLPIPAFLFLVLAVPLHASERHRVLTQNASIDNAPSAYSGAVYTKEAAPGDTVWIRVYDVGDASCNTVLDPGAGGQGLGLGPGYATWCWEGGDLGGGVFDSCSNTTAYTGSLPGCFTHEDIWSGFTNQWHLDTFGAFPEGGPPPDYSAWCGAYGDTLVWNNTDGYGPHYNYSLILNLGQSAGGGFNPSSGFTLGGVHMYDTEINYDYCYLEYTVSDDINLAVWSEAARYTGTSFASIGCPDASGGGDHGCANFGAFRIVLPALDNSTADLLVRWRFASDGTWDDDDAMGGVHTDGAWRVDSVFAVSIADGSTYPAGGGYQGFENGTFPAEWSTPGLPGAQIGGYWSGGRWVNGFPQATDWWHLELDPSYANSGDTYFYSNTWMWAADDPNHSQNQEDRYHYRLVSPVFESGTNNPYTPGTAWSGVIVESDEYFCLYSIVGDVIDTRRRVFNSNTGRWGRFSGDEYVINGGCTFWEIDKVRDWSSALTANTDSIQFSWEFFDRCEYNSSVELPCMGQHRKATWLIDNVSIGVFTRNNTRWKLAAPDKLQDTFARNVDMHSARKENSELSALDMWESEDSLSIHVSDYDGIKGNGVKIHWRISTDCGQTWDKDNGRAMGANDTPAEAYNQKTLNLSDPDFPQAAGTSGEFNGIYRTRLRISDNTGYLGMGATLWPEGSVVEYFFTAEDSTNSIDTFPNRLSLSRTSVQLVNPVIGFDRRLPWPLEVSVLPCPTSKRPLGTQTGTILLVDNYPYRVYDLEVDPDLDYEKVIDFPYTWQVYQEALDRLGLTYDRYDNNAAGLPLYTQPTASSGWGGILDHSGSFVTGLPSSPSPGGSDDGTEGVTKTAAVSRRYDAVIWFTGSFNEHTVLDSSQLEIATYLDSSGTQFPTSGLFWLLGDNLCEDGALSDPAWTNSSGEQTTGGARLWVNLAGLAAVAGGCTDGTGVNLPGYYFEGDPAGDFSTITMAVANQLSGTMENDMKVQDVKPIARKSDELNPHGGGPGTIQGTAEPTGEEVAVSSELAPPAFAGSRNSPNVLRMHSLCLGLITSGQVRDCMVYFALQGIIGGATGPADCNIDVNVEETPPAVTSLRLGPAYPNPFNPSVTLPFALPRAGHVRLAIYDLTGRRVRTLFAGHRKEGIYSDEQAATWDGKNGSGDPVPSGVYFANLESVGSRSTTKILLLR